MERLRKFIVLIILLLAVSVNATTYYVAAGVASTNVGAAIDINTPCNLNAAWDDMCAATTIGTGDTIQLADGTYNDDVNDVPVAGLGDCAVNIDLTIEGASNGPTLCIIDFSGNNAGVDGFHITTTGEWTFKGLTIHGQKSTSTEGNITFIDGTLNVRNCIIHSGSRYGIKMTSTAAAAAVYLYNCEVYGTADDGVHSGGDGGADSDHIQEAHYCYFHDITTAAFTQALTMHEEGTTRAYFCTFRNIGTGTPKTSGAAIGQGAVDHIYAYNCIVEDCYVGFAGEGIIELRNCYIDTYFAAIENAGGTDALVIENCIIRGNTANGANLITITGASDTTIRHSILWSEAVGGKHILRDASGDAGLTLIFEDNLVYSPDSSDLYLIRYSGDWTFRRNLIWTNGDATSNLGIFRNDDTGAVTMNLEHNCIRKGGTDNLWFASGTDTYTGGYNTVDGGTTLASGISAKATDQFETITWRSFSNELMLSPNAGHYRDFGAAMMPGWYRPDGDNNMGAFVRNPIERIFFTRYRY